MGAEQRPALEQTLLMQSLDLRHLVPFSHGLQAGPPQSSSVSLPFFVWSLQVGIKQTLDLALSHTPPMQSSPARHLRP